MRRSFGRTYIPGFIDLKRWLKLWIYTWNENNNNELYLYIIHPCYCIWSNILQTTKSILSKSKHEREPIDVDFCRPSYKSDGNKNVANFAAEVDICVKKKKILKYYWLCYLELTACLKTPHWRKFQKIGLSISSSFLSFNLAAAKCHKNRLNYQTIEE